MSEPAAPSVEPPCARCAKVQKTCCQRAEILVTVADVDRIRQHARRDAFWEHRTAGDPGYTEPDDEDPNWVAYTVRADGRRRMLRRRADGDCTFLGTVGCELPVDVRPLVCRLYPYAYTEDALIGVDSEYCPTKMLAADGRPMTEVLDMPAAVAEDWRRQLYEELRHGSP